MACVVAEGGEVHGSLVCVGGVGAGDGVESLAPAAAGWVQRPPLSSGGRAWFGAVACGAGGLLLLGGLRDGGASASVERLEPRCDFAYAALPAWCWLAVEGLDLCWRQRSCRTRRRALARSFRR